MDQQRIGGAGLAKTGARHHDDQIALLHQPALDERPVQLDKHLVIVIGTIGVLRHHAVEQAQPSAGSFAGAQTDDHLIQSSLAEQPSREPAFRPDAHQARAELSSQDLRAVHDRIRRARRIGGSNRIIPWLTTGTCGYVCPRSARVMIWETFLNGAGGLTYYCFADFNPAHLIEVARALAAVAPLEAVIAGGAAAHDQVRLGDDAIRHSAIRRDNRAALLLVNTTDRQRTATWRWDGTAARGHTTVPAMDAVLLDVRLAE